LAIVQSSIYEWIEEVNDGGNAAGHKAAKRDSVICGERGHEEGSED
jgi:hypothetical protein